MKVVKSLFIVLIGFLSACSSNSSPQDSEVFIIDPSLRVSETAEILNPAISGYPLGIISSEEGLLALVNNRLIIDPVDQAGLEAILQKYQATIVNDSNIPLPEDTILDENGAHSGGTSYHLIEVPYDQEREGDYAKYARGQGVSLPVTVESAETKALLNIMGRMFLEDSGKFRDLQVAAYAFEKAKPLLPEVNFATFDWAECSCLWTDADGSLKTRDGAEWDDHPREAPIYNSLLEDFAGNQICTYHDGIDRHGERFIPQGDNVLILDFAAGYTNHESSVTGPVGNFHLWAFPRNLLPLSLPSQLDTAAPPGAVHILLKGPAHGCEWAKPDPEQYLAYQNYILWDWDREPTSNLMLFLWEGDECINLFGAPACNADDKIAMFEVPRGSTVSPSGLEIHDIDQSSATLGVYDFSPERTIDLQIRTIDFCRANGPNANEYCNGYDDNCNGESDEGFELKGTHCNNGGIGQCKSEGKLVCIDTTQQRAGEYPLICNSTSKQPSPFEICDGIDNDCDGQTDESWIQEGLACGLNVGTCGVGALGCTSGHISCEGEVLPTQEICDGLDNDCDGVTDEGCSCSIGESRACSIDIGPCSLGIQECLSDGTWAASCSGTVPQPEICDGVDNNCNSAVDEGVLNRCGTCGPEPSEVCDGIDNDCDGEVDEGVTNACGGCWTIGPEEYASATADCDGIDNDCDGFIDETDSVVTCGVGLCQSEVDTVCEECNPGQPRIENWDAGTCLDNQDNDCDGLTDLDDLPDCFQLQGGGG